LRLAKEFDMEIRHVSISWESESQQKVRYEYDDGAGVAFTGLMRGKPIAAAYDKADTDEQSPEIKAQLIQFLSSCPKFLANCKRAYSKATQSTPAAAEIQSLGKRQQRTPAAASSPCMQSMTPELADYWERQSRGSLRNHAHGFATRNQNLQPAVTQTRCAVA
jgi:hypothetical protein